VLAVVVCGFLAVSILAHTLMSRPTPVAQRRLAALGAGNASNAATAPADDGPARGELMMMKFRTLVPAQLRDRIERLLYAAGMPMKPEVAVLIWVGAAAGLPLLYFGLAGSSDTGKMMLYGGGLIVLGGYFPMALVKSRAGKRRKQILRSMPDMMDLLTTCVEAGLGIDAALARVGEKAKEPLGSEIRTTLNNISMGHSRRQALEALAARNGVNELTTFVTAVVQAESMGTSLGTTLRVQAEAVRLARKQRAEQAAQKAPIKIIIVLVLLVFPAMFTVILGPAVISFMQSGGIH
jgi:tight adherence protein C